MTRVKFKELNILNKKIDRWQKKDKVLPVMELHNFRNRVFYIYTRLEVILNALIWLEIFKPIIQGDPQKKSMNVAIRFIDGVNFHRKLKLAYELKLISRQLFNDMSYVNTIRVHSSHPTSYEKKINLYRDKQNQIKILNIIIKTREVAD